MEYRLVIEMNMAEGAEARLWALMAQRRVDVSRALFEKHGAEQIIRATLDFEADAGMASRLTRQLTRHHNIIAIHLEPPEENAVRLGVRRMHMTPSRRAYL